MSIPIPLIYLIAAFIVGGFAAFWNDVWLFPYWVELDLLEHYATYWRSQIWIKTSEWIVALTAGLVIGLICKRYWISIGVCCSASFVLVPHLMIFAYRFSSLVMVMGNS